MSKTQPIYPITLSQPHLTFQHKQIQNKLHHILNTLELENEEIRKYYTSKLDTLRIQLENKHKELQDVRRCVSAGVGSCGKCRDLEWKVLEKDNVIEDLNQRIRNLQQVFKQKLHEHIDKLDLTLHTNTSKTNENTSCHTGKRINISQYYIKAVENTKNPATNTNKTDTTSTKMENAPSSKNDNISTKIDGDISTVNQSRLEQLVSMENRLKNDSDPTGLMFKLGGLSKVKSLHEQQFYKWENSIRLSKNNKTPTNPPSTSPFNSHSPHNNTQNHSLNHNINPNSNPNHTTEYSSTNPDKFITSETKDQRSKIKIHNNLLDSNNSSIEQRRKILMQQRWKQVSAFQRRRQNNRNKVSAVCNT